MNLSKISKWNQKKVPFSINSRLELWTYPQTAKKMLEYHLQKNDIASRNQNEIKKSVDFMYQYFKLDNTKHICDLGCCPGLYTKLFAKKGVYTTGIDFSENSIMYAKNAACKDSLVIDYRIMNYLDFSDNNKYDLITLIYYDYCSISKKERIKLLKNIKRALKKNGNFYFDIVNENAFYKEEKLKGWNYSNGDGFWFEEPYLELYEKILYEKEKTTLTKYYISGIQGEKIIYCWHKYFSIDVLIDELLEADFSIVEYFSDIKGSKYEDKDISLAIVAK